MAIASFGKAYSGTTFHALGLVESVLHGASFQILACTARLDGAGLFARILAIGAVLLRYSQRGA